jgi:hypothetical protein
MKLHILTAVSGIALSAVLLASPAGAQGSYPAPGGERVDANDMPTTHSTPEEKAQTAELNNQATANAAQAQDQTRENDAHYQAQQQQYQQQQQQYQNDVRHQEAQQERYEDRTAMYEDLRARYAAERAAYHRDFGPSIIGPSSSATPTRSASALN